MPGGRGEAGFAGMNMNGGGRPVGHLAGGGRGEQGGEDAKKGGGRRDGGLRVERFTATVGEAKWTRCG